jgi:hypothetical protein
MTFGRSESTDRTKPVRRDPWRSPDPVHPWLIAAWLLLVILALFAILIAYPLHQLR